MALRSLFGASCHNSLRSTNQKNVCQKARRTHGCDIFVRICTTKFFVQSLSFWYSVLISTCYLKLSSFEFNIWRIRQTINLKLFWMNFMHRNLNFMRRKNAKNELDRASLRLFSSYAFFTRTYTHVKV